MPRFHAAAAAPTPRWFFADTHPHAYARHAALCHARMHVATPLRYSAALLTLINDAADTPLLPLDTVIADAAADADVCQMLERRR